MRNCSPLKRSSMTLENKLQIYEFEVDENEPKTKQKKKRGPKPGAKNKPKNVGSKKGILKSPLKSQINKKVLLIKKPLVSSAKVEDGKGMLSARNNCDTNTILKETNNMNRVLIPAQKENIIPPTVKKIPLKNNVPKGILSARDNNSVPVCEKRRSSRRLSLKNENVFSQKSEQFSGKESILKKTTAKESDASFLERSYLRQEDTNIPISRKENSPNTIEVPVLFHKQQDDAPFKQNFATPNKKKSPCGTKKSFTAMIDDDDMNKSNKKFDLDHYFSSNTKKSKDKSAILSRTSSFSHDTSYDYNINASTPVKYNYNETCGSDSVLNCFGFDEPELFEEPLVSPIKNCERDLIQHFVDTKNNSSKLQQQISEKKEEIPVTQVIRLLKYGTNDDENNVETRSSSSSNCASPIFSDLIKDDDKHYQPVEIMSETASTSTRAMPRRSYERPAYLRKLNKSFEEEECADADHIEDKAKPILPKKRHGQSKKEQEEMRKWIKAFNSQCQEIDNFDLVVE